MKLIRWSAALMLCALGTASFSSPVLAQGATSVEILRQHAYAGTLQRGEQELAARAAAQPSDREAVAALGMARFALAIERLGQSFHRHGLRSTDDFGLGLPVLRLPVPHNPNPEPLSYEELRAIYVRLLADLERARSTLGDVRASDVRIPLDLNAVRLDLNGDGRGGDDETLGAIVQSLGQPAWERRNQQAQDRSQPWNVTFDYADTIGLNGYANLLSAVMEFVLAHDWRDTFHGTGHIFFPRVAGGSGVVQRSQPSRDLGGDSGARVADAIALIHLVRWPVIEPQRMSNVRRHLLNAVALSRANWDAILAETDDENEWLPSPRQRSVAVAAMQVTDETIAAWRRVLDQFEAVLEGRVLLGHWRLAGGIDVRRVFEEPRTFDLVLWITGQGAMPYLRDDARPLTTETWGDWQRAFRGNFLGFALWFN
jgi:hypothetical protein